MRYATTTLLSAALVLGSGCTGDAGPPGADGQSAKGETGEQGPPGSAVGEASINSIIPTTVFLDRTVEVAIGGFGTSWNDNNIDKEDLDFGAGVKVTGLVVASPTSLVAKLEIDRTVETVGVKTVDVGGLAFIEAFEVKPPIAIELLQSASTVQQGSVVRVVANQLDLSSPFATSDMFGFSQADNVIEAYGSMAHVVGSASLYAMPFDLLVDVFAPTGSSELEIISGPLGAPGTPSYMPDAGLDVLPRTAAVMAGTSHVDRLNESGESKLVVRQIDSSAVYQVNVTSNDPSAEPVIFVLPSSGRFDELVTRGERPRQEPFDPLPLPSTAFMALVPADYHFVVYDAAGEVDHDVTIDLVEHPFSGVTPLPFDTAVPGAVSVSGEAHVHSFDVTTFEPMTLVLSDGATSTCPADIDAVIVIFDSRGGAVAYGGPGCANAFFFPNEMGTHYAAVAESPTCAPSGCPFDYNITLSAISF